MHSSFIWTLIKNTALTKFPIPTYICHNNVTFGGPEPHKGWDTQTPKILWEVQKDPIGPPEEIKWLSIPTLSWIF